MKYYTGRALLKLANMLDKISLVFGHWEQDANYYGQKLIREHYDNEIK